MKKKSVAWRCCAAIVLCSLCGCETVTVPHTPTTIPKTNYNAIASATDKLMMDMRKSPAFNRNYLNVKKKKALGCLPAIVVREIDLLQTDIRLDPVIVRNTVQSSLNEAGLFDVRSDGFNGAVDYDVSGYIKSDGAVDNPSYHLWLKLQDRNSGSMIWSGTEYNLGL